MRNPSIPAGSVALVTGATGFTGSNLVKKLLLLGVKVRAIARHSSDLAPFKDLPIEWYRGDVFDKEVIAAAIKDVNYIFHTAAAYREAKIKDIDYSNVHLLATQLLAKSALKESSLRRFVHLSTVGVHGHIETPPADEEYPFNPGDIYQSTKLEGELWIREFAKNEGLPLTVIRPTAIFGPGDKRLLKLFKMASKPICPILGFGRTLYHLIHVEDLTDFIILVSTHSNAEGEVFICGNTESISLPKILNLIAKQINRSPFIVRIPVTPFFIVADLCEWICQPFGIEPPIYRRRVAFFTKDRSFNTTKSKRLLQFEPRYTNETGLADTAKWYIDNGWIKGR